MTGAVDREVDTVRDLVARVHAGEAASAQIVSDCLAAIEATEPQIRAWQFLDRESAAAQAEAMDDIRRRGRPVGALHGIPVGIKDIFDTADMPTERGSPIYAGRRPEADCAVVEKLREAGAVILGKTVTTEFAWLQPAVTRNPHDPARAPGGSSSGSAAAVAAGHVPLAVGSQTNGSTIRPASYCGVYGFKPTRGIVSRRGVLQTSQTLDQVGVFGRDAGDVALLADVLGGYDASDSSCYLAPRPRMLQGYLAEVPIEPSFAWIDMPYAERYSPATRAGCEELLEAMGSRVERLPAPRSFAVLIECHKVIYEFEMRRNLDAELTTHGDRLSPALRAALQAAEQRTQAQYDEALEVLAAAVDWFEQFFCDYDAIVTPSATGEAPPLDAGTGDPICSTIWTLCGLPCLSIPLLVGTGGLPIGIQLVANANEDDRLFRTTRWLLEQLEESTSQ